MIKSRLFILFFTLFSFSTSIFSQIPIGKSVMDYEVYYEGETLSMNGGGVRSMLFIDLYSSALYLKEKSSDPIAIAYENESMAIIIKITSKLISRDTMLKAFVDGFDKATDGNVEPLQARIDKLSEFYLKELVVGDIIELVYVKDKGVICYMNNKELGVIRGQDFKFALYKIWLGEQPVSKSLKKDMLGKA